MKIKQLFKKMTRFLNDKTYIKLSYLLVMKKFLNLKKPETLNEKIQWLKLYNRDENLTIFVDKLKVKSVIADWIGEEFVIKTLGYWENFDDIDFTKLPNQFVLKCSHDSHSVVICKDKQKFDYIKAKKKLEKCLKANYYWHGREWAYKNVKPVIMAEELLIDDDYPGQLIDYKFYCFKDYVDSVMLCLDRESGNPKYYFYNKKWQLLKDYNHIALNSEDKLNIEKPLNYEVMYDLASKLSLNTQAPFVRVDFYNIKGKIYFGELTFSPTNGLDRDYTEKTDKYFGSLVDLSSINFNKNK